MKKSLTRKKPKNVVPVFGGSLPKVSSRWGKAHKERARDMCLHSHELYYEVNRILCDAMNLSGAVIEPCPHCPGASVHNLTIHRGPFPSLTISLPHRCPYLMYGLAWGWGQFVEEPLPVELVREIVYGPSLWS